MADNQITNATTLPTSTRWNMPQAGSTRECCPPVGSNGKNNCDSYLGRNDVNSPWNRGEKSPSRQGQGEDDFLKIIKLFLEIIKNLIGKEGKGSPGENNKNSANRFALADNKERA